MKRDTAGRAPLANLDAFLVDIVVHDMNDALGLVNVPPEKTADLSTAEPPEGREQKGSLYSRVRFRGAD
jgi:hypothetical protein